MFPFAGVDSKRPYPPTGLTTARWVAEVPTENVAFADLWLTQRQADIPALFGITDRVSDDYPHVVEWPGIRYVEDGHNRVVRAALCDQATTLPMRVYRIR